MKIAVSAASGQLGRLVIEDLKKRVSPDSIVALARTPKKISDLGVEVRAFDYTKPEELVDGLKGVDRLLLISSSEIGQRAVQHANVIEAATSVGLDWIVYTSLLRADTSTLSLAGEHVETEKRIRESGLMNTILRNGWYTENYTGSIQGALAGGAFIGSAGSGKISSAARRDFAEAAAAVITDEKNKGKMFELAGDTSYTLSDLASEISRQSGKTIPYKDLPMEEYAKVLMSFELPEGISHAIASWDVSASKGDLYSESNDLSSLIGRPTTPLSDSVAEVVKSQSQA
jgi:NAD(P)H dehydrogenase (quinone)